MTAILRALVVLLLCLIQLRPGECRVKHIVYSKERDDASLPCENVVHEDCSSTTWLYGSPGSRDTSEEVSRGKIKSNSKRADRLKLDSGCSLKIINVTSQDAGEYRCQQYLKEHGSQHGNEALVSLYILTVSPSIPASELKADSNVTFYCHLATYDCAQDQNEITLKWTGFEHHQYNKYAACNISFTKTLTKEDNNWSLQCTVKWKGEVKAFVDYTINLQGEDGTHLYMAVIGAVSGTVAVVLGAFLIVLWRRKTKQQTASVRSEIVSTNGTEEKMEGERTSKPSKEVLAEQGLTYAEVNITANTSISRTAHQETEYASVKTTSYTHRPTQQLVFQAH